MPINQTIPPPPVDYGPKRICNRCLGLAPKVKPCKITPSDGLCYKMMICADCHNDLRYMHSIGQLADCMKPYETFLVGRTARPQRDTTQPARVDYHNSGYVSSKRSVFNATAVQNA